MVSSGDFPLARAPSSVVEHVTFNHGVPGSIPGGPILRSRLRTRVSYGWQASVLLCETFNSIDERVRGVELLARLEAFRVRAVSRGGPCMRHPEHIELTQPTDQLVRTAPRRVRHIPLKSFASLSSRSFTPIAVSHPCDSTRVHPNCVSALTVGSVGAFNVFIPGNLVQRKRTWLILRPPAPTATARRQDRCPR